MLSSHGLAALQVRFNKKNKGTFPKYTTPMETVVYRLVHQRERKVLRSSHQQTHMESNRSRGSLYGILGKIQITQGEDEI